jgi:hypothetical protein
MTKLAALAEQEERRGVDLGHDGMADDSCEEGFDDTNNSTVVGLRTRLAVQAEQEESHGVDLGHDGMAEDSCESHKEVATVPGGHSMLCDAATDGDATFDSDASNGSLDNAATDAADSGSFTEEVGLVTEWLEGRLKGWQVRLFQLGKVSDKLKVVCSEPGNDRVWRRTWSATLAAPSASGRSYSSQAERYGFERRLAVDSETRRVMDTSNT